MILTVYAAILVDRKITNKENTVTAFALSVVAQVATLAYAVVGAAPQLIGG